MPRTAPLLGGRPLPDGSSEFAVWAPAVRRVSVRGAHGETVLEPREDGFHTGVAALGAGDDYVYVLDGTRARPDPCSRRQPGGVRGPSQLVTVEDASGVALTLDELVLYELHVGTFTGEGVFTSAARRLPELVSLGVTAVELMPVATFPGSRGWGYDGLYTWAPHEAYGGPAGLRRFVEAAHALGLGVVLDVVYNHLGPGDEAVRDFGPWLTDRVQTPWGHGLDYRRPGVREWAIQNAELWVREYGIDGLRLDAVHAVVDDSPEHVLAELARRVRALRRDVLVISEMGVPDFRPLDEWGHDAMWLDALHHELHVALTGERGGYYADHDGSMTAIRRELERPRAERLVACAQNHDQVGNRARGDRLPPDALLVAQAAVLFSPLTPLLFQGEEYAESRPFQFFTDHIDPEVAEATREGRRREFSAFMPSGEEVPDPQERETFERSVLAPADGDREHLGTIERLLRLRRRLPRRLEVVADDERRTLVLRRGDALLRLDFAARTVELVAPER